MGPCYRPVLDFDGVCSMGPVSYVVHTGYIEIPDWGVHVL